MTAAHISANGVTTSVSTWFGRVMWLGILANVALAVPTLLRPAEMLAWMGLPAAPLVWVRFASVLLILLSSFYVPAAIDCRSARTNAWLATASRLAGVLFFFTQERIYWVFGVYDGVFLIPLALLLALGATTQAGRPAVLVSAR